MFTAGTDSVSIHGANNLAKIMNKLNRIALAVTLAFGSTTLHAFESHIIRNSEGTAIFDLRFFDPGDGQYFPEQAPSTWSLNADQKNKILQGMEYWAEVIRPAPGFLPAAVNVGTMEDENAYGYSSPLFDEESGIRVSQLFAALNGLDPDEPTLGAVSHFSMGRLDWDTAEFLPSQLPTSGQFEVMSTAMHELAHGLGIMSTADMIDEDMTKPIFEDYPDPWTEHLRDDNGNPARPSQKILCQGCTNEYDPTAFDVRKDQGYFTGPNVDEVLEGGLRGVPVRILGSFGGIDPNYMSHIELENSVMSHQLFRNYTVFMEAELAVLQDVGYDIDRRKFFGYSIYGDNRVVYNDNGYFQRNSAGTGYLDGQHSETALGLGLHIYGSYNTVYQRADLLTRGAGGAGIRVDGQGNSVEIPRGVRIHADGYNGRGLMVAYGRNHIIRHHGDIQALGPLGVGANFDFGTSALGEDQSVRGSYIHRVFEKEAPLLDELNGPLVSQFDISGRIAGTAASIYMSPNAYVKDINFLQGAQLQGDIHSLYREVDEQGQLRLTHLNFGQGADASGHASGKADANFRMEYQGNIQGTNLSLRAQGGHTSLNGEHVLHNARIDRGATLLGNSRYTVDASQALINDGTLSPGNSIGRVEIQGNYAQTPQGTLLIDVNGAGAHDVLAVSGQAQLDGQLLVAPQVEWYGSDWAVPLSNIVAAGTTTGSFNSTAASIASPTLSVSLAAADTGTQLRIQRPVDAYSQYAVSGNSQATGQALHALARNAGGDARELLTNLDFSAPDGSAVSRTLDQLSPDAYSALFSASLQREQQISSFFLSPGMAPVADANPAGQWAGFAVPFGSHIDQDSRGSIVGHKSNTYGLLFGAQRTSAAHAGLRYGVHAAASDQRVRMRDGMDVKGDTTAFSVGAHFEYVPDQTAGMHFFGAGRIGVEQGDIKRTVSIGSYQSRNTADWTGKYASVGAGAGYRFALTESFSLGPVASLNYTRLSRPSLTEDGRDGSRLELASAKLNSLRSSVGVAGTMKHELASGKALSGRIQITWDRELLRNDLTQDAQFAGYGDTAFGIRNRVMGRDALSVSGSLAYQATDRFAVGAQVASELFRAGQKSFSGNLFAQWRF